MDLFRDLYALAKVLLAEDGEDATAELLLKRIREVTGADRGFIVVREGDKYVQRFDVDFDRDRVSAEERRFSRTVVRAAIGERQVVATERPGDDPRFAQAESVELLGAVSVRAAPLVDGNEVVGVIYLERRAGPFAADVGPLLVEVGAIAAVLIRRALERESLRRRNRALERDLFGQHDFQGIITRDPLMLELLRVAAQVADSGASVLVRGETGTGKELIAKALHVNSGRRRKPFVTLHCSALPPTLFESELFGHVRGAFTGADRDRPGRIAQADGGTLFLDEVGEIPPELQSKLLRFLQFGEIQRAGADRLEKVDVRVVAATHQDLAALIQDKKFRQDLYFRLKVVELSVPPLRERKGDVLLLADAFLDSKARRGEKLRLSPRTERALEAHGWPGNVRELEHVIERACLLARGSEIDVELLPPEVVGAAPAATSSFGRYDADELSAARATAVEAVERDFVRGLMAKAGGNVSQASRESGLNRTYLQKLLARYR